MIWTLNKENARFRAQLSASAQGKWDIFQNAIYRGSYPKDAAKLAGGMDYKMLSGSSNQYQIRLSGSERATFRIDEVRQIVTVLQVGGHT
ncbi:hypothetical protein ACIPL1_04260 [Pseudomonas sp. NPDC090202]|uniref:hypothetical protein n=1 Tax=unclassified Pseudomonas TaxID=196821 RepID=UPI0037F44909